MSLFLPFLPAPSQAQDNTGTISGTVQDNAAAVVPGVTVTITDAAGTARTATSDERGEYLATGLAPGPYTISVSLQGFQDFLLKGVAVIAGQTSRTDITLLPAKVTEKVNVEGNAVTQVEQQTSQISGTITSKELTQLMLNGRNFTQLIALTPGVSNQTGQDEALVGVKGSVKYSVNGGRVEYNSFEVDGGDILNASVNGSNTTLIVYPSLDAIDQLQVLTSNYGAQYGRSASGITVATTKSGGADFHGDGYIFFRNEKLNARNFFDQTDRAPLYRKYDPGFTIGGPLYIPGVFNAKKDKTFFFVSEEWRHEEEPVAFNQAVPSAMERAGNFSDVCPTSGKIDPNNTGAFIFTRSLAASHIYGIPYFPDCPGLVASTVSSVPNQNPNFPNNLFPNYDTFGLTNQINSSLVSPQSQAIVGSGLFPLPNSTAGCNSTIKSVVKDQSGNIVEPNNLHCYDASISPLTTWHQDLFRIDHNFTPKEKLYVRYIHDSWDTTVLSPQYALVFNSVPTVQNTFSGPGLSVAAHLTSTVGTTFVNDASMAFGVQHIKLKNIPGPGVQSLNRSDYPTFALPPCDDVTSQQCQFGGIGYLFGTPAKDSNGVPFGNKLPAIVLEGPNFAYGGQSLTADTGYMPWRQSNPTYSPRDDVTLALHNHTLQFGVLFIIAQRNEINPPVGANTGNVQGTLFLNSSDPNSVGNVFADLLLFGNNQASTGIPEPTATYTQDSAQSVYHNNYKIVEPYIEDDWKVTRRLTVNLGFRASLFGLYREKYHNAYNWVPSQFDSSLASQLSFFQRTGALAIGPTTPLGPNNFLPIDINNLSPYLTNGLVHCGVDKYKNGQPVPDGCMTGHLFNPAPRVGFAWDPLGNGKTSIRGGYGIFFEHGTGNEANTGSLEGSPANVSAAGVINQTQYGVPSWACIGNVGQGCLAQTSGGNAFPIGVTAIPTKATWPYTQQWNLSIQRELPGNFLASIAYVGSKGTHLTAQLNANQLVPVNAAQNPFLPGQPLSSNYCQVVGQAILGTPSTWNGQPIGPGLPGWGNSLASCYTLLNGTAVTPLLPGTLRTPGNVIAPYLGQIYSLQNVANSNYNGMQFSLRRTLAPLTLGVSYTYSHAIDDSSDRTTATFINAYNLASNRASSDYDQRHLFSISYVYQLPLMKVWEALQFADDDPTNEISGHHSDESKKMAARFFSNWELSGITIYQTGTPFSILNAGGVDGISAPDNAGVVTVAGPASYADRATTNPFPNATGTNNPATFGPLLGNTGQFQAPTGLTFGNTGRNFFRNPNRINFDMALEKSFPLSEGRSMQLRIEGFNVFNHTQFRIYDASHPGNAGNNIISCYGDTNGNAGDPSCDTSAFLHPIDAHRPRTMQIGFKFLF